MPSGKPFGDTGPSQSSQIDEDIERLFDRITDSDSLRAAPMMRNRLTYLFNERHMSLTDVHGKLIPQIARMGLRENRRTTQGRRSSPAVRVICRRSSG